MPPIPYIGRMVIFCVVPSREAIIFFFSSVLPTICSSPAPNDFLRISKKSASYNLELVIIKLKCWN
uniref:Uncharacterized protein n=1 Tax=Arundo donax TaxID=35708 RepID=A0A0A8YER0_ARUDO